MKRRSGDEKFIIGDKPAVFTVKDFWSWSYSDMMINTYRGLLAEFLVAQALGVANDESRFFHPNYDIEFIVNAKTYGIEVKASAYRQSWGDGKIDKGTTKPSFDISQSFRRPYSNPPEKGRFSDVYVFCLHNEKCASKADALNLSQWSFYPVATWRITKKFSDQKRSRISKINDLTDPFSFNELRKEVVRIITTDIMEPSNSIAF